MSSHTDTKRRTVPAITAMKGSTPIVSLTAYNANMAALVDPHADFILVGDSLGMVAHGMDSTLPVSLDLMIAHGRAVVAGTGKALIVVDMPFGSYEESPEVAFRNAARILKETGCAAVKVEGGTRMADTIRFLVDRGIPVMGHIGLTPQSSHVMGGFKTQGRDRATWPAHHEDATAVANAGAFAVVLEGMVEELAATLTKQIAIPTIGIGASPACDGQILVLEDMLGLTQNPPKFVKVFADIGSQIDSAVKTYAQAVRDREFPTLDQTYR
jgi:3-methyl-2-oxobutanoate hydroxymethyltransferase